MSVLGVKRKIDATDETKVAPIADFKPFQAFGVLLPALDSKIGRWIIDEKVDKKKNPKKYNYMVYVHNCVQQFNRVFRQWFCGPNTRIVMLDDGHRRTEYPFEYNEHYRDITTMIKFWRVNMRLYSVNETVMFLAIHSQLQIFWKSAVFCKTNTNYYDQRHCLEQLVIDIRQLDEAIRNCQDDKKLEPINQRWWRDLIAHFRDMANRRCAFNVAKILTTRKV